MVTDGYSALAGPAATDIDQFTSKFVAMELEKPGFMRALSPSVEACRGTISECVTCLRLRAAYIGET